jgi:hypothetical protein
MKSFSPTPPKPLLFDCIMITLSAAQIGSVYSLLYTGSFYFFPAVLALLAVFFLSLTLRHILFAQFLCLLEIPLSAGERTSANTHTVTILTSKSTKNILSVNALLKKYVVIPNQFTEADIERIYPQIVHEAQHLKNGDGLFFHIVLPTVFCSIIVSAWTVISGDFQHGYLAKKFSEPEIGSNFGVLFFCNHTGNNITSIIIYPITGKPARSRILCRLYSSYSDA